MVMHSYGQTITLDTITSKTITTNNNRYMNHDQIVNTKYIHVYQSIGSSTFVIETLTYICEVEKTIGLLEKDYLIILTKNIG